MTVVDVDASPHVKFHTVGLNEARWTGGFWGDWWERDARVTVPSMKQVMELPANSATFANLRVAAGQVPDGKFAGNAWGDGDCYKWIEAAASIFALTHDPELDRQMDELIGVIAKAQAPDGYLGTQIQLTDKGRWSDLNNHELYNMGHLLTAACVHRRVTGKDSFLNVARKVADYLCAIFEPRPPALAHFCFNPSNIMGAAELYRTTGEARYLKLAETFVSMRGSQPGGSDQNQARVPLRQESEAVGHAVTGAYLWCGAADVCAETGEPALLSALERIWEDVDSCKTYITGGTGALHHGESHRVKLKRKPDSVHEAFGAPYQLPNRTAYNETCGNIGSAMWSWRMLLLTGEAQYADAMERVFYNSMLSAIGLSGKEYFYTNPLSRAAASVRLENNDAAVRWANTTPESPVHCFCCPPSLARTLAQLHSYAYGLSADAVWVHLFGGSRLETRLSGGEPVTLSQETGYPWDGRILIRWEQAPAQETGLRLRVPAWVTKPALRINGVAQPAELVPGTYTEVRRRWTAGDTVELDLPMEVRLTEAHPLVEEDRGRVAVMRGPLVYCLEEKDLPERVKPSEVMLERSAAWSVRFDPALLQGVTVLETKGKRLPQAASTALYRPLPAGGAEPVALRLIPYYAWCNRGASEMTVWLPVR